MSTLAGVQIKCPKCDAYLADRRERIPLICPQCGLDLQKEWNLSGEGKRPQMPKFAVAVLIAVAIAALPVIPHSFGQNQIIAWALLISALLGFAFGSLFGVSTLYRLAFGGICALAAVCLVLAFVMSGCHRFLRGGIAP